MKQRLRMAWRALRGVFVAFVLAVLVGVGAGPAFAKVAPSGWHIGLLLFVLLFVAVSVARRVRYKEPTERAKRVSRWAAWGTAIADVELGLAMIAGCYGLFAATGGLGSPLYPMLYGVIAFSCTLLSRTGALFVPLFAAILELAAVGLHGGPFALSAFHLLFIAGAAASHVLFLHGAVHRFGRREARRAEEDIRRARRSARDFRLIAAPLSADSRPARSREAEQDELARGSLELISQSLFSTVGFVKRALGARTCVVLWCDEQAERLSIKEVVSDSDAIAEGEPILPRGPLRAVMQGGKTVTLDQAKAAHLQYYSVPMNGAALAAVPILEGGHVRGALCVDRGQSFDPQEVDMLTAAAEQIARTVRSERGFFAIERARYEHERFYQASAMLCRALTTDEVASTAFDAVGLIVDYDVAALTLYEAERKRHRVCSFRINPESAPLVSRERLEGLEFRENAGLVSMVVKNRHYLPASGDFQGSDVPVFTQRVPVRGAASLVVLPLLCADKAIGTLTLASQREHQFRKDIREMLGVIANQVAISLQNALMYRKMETMATTDGLTGLTNHRAFQERLSQLLDRASRHGHHVSLLLLDVDHFKSVNDTHGHPVGDTVLRKVAGVLNAATRRIDMTARYGGEEFAVVLEAADEAGALNLAERIRQDVAALKVDGESGPFSVTTSVGVACYPRDATDQAELIERADHALYCAKETGRNRVVAFREMSATSKRAV